MGKKVRFPLDTASIDAAIAELNAYRAALPGKVQKLLDQMVAYGEDFAINAVGHVDTGWTVSTVAGFRNGNRGVISAGGNAVWLEFGTGVKYNGPAGSSPHPRGNDFGFRIGEYGQGHGADKQGWWYLGDDGDVHHTYGIKANLFLYRTAQELRRLYPAFAREVFHD